MYNYVVTAHKPSRVSHTAVGSFLAPDQRNLLVAKVNYIYVYTITREGLSCTIELPIYGTISGMHLMRMTGETQDHLVVITEKYKLCVLRWNAAESRCHVVSSGDMEDHFVSTAISERLSIVDPKAKCIALYQYKRLLKVIPTERDADKTAFNVRLMEDSVHDMVFLHGCQNPTIAILCSRGKDNRELRTYEIRMSDQDIAPTIWKKGKLDVTSAKLFAVPEPVCGVLVFGDDLVTYMNANGDYVTQPFDSTIITAVGQIDDQGTRYLVGDHKGQLSILLLVTENNVVKRIKMEILGETSMASCISYLDSSFVFIGSSKGDSQLVRLRRDRNEETGTFVEIVQTYPHLGPILDFCIVKGMGYLRHGQGQVVTCSGVGKDGSLRIIRNGIGISEHASEELPGIKDMFSLKRHIGDRYDSYLIQTFTSATRTLELISADEMAPASLPGFDEDTPTLHAANMEGDIMVQVTTKGVQVTDCGTMTSQSTYSWVPPANMRISIASGNSHQLLLATTGGHLILLKVDQENKTLVEVTQTKMDREISCLNCNFMRSTNQMTDIEESLETRGQAFLAVVGQWAEVNETPVVKLIALPSLRILETIELGGDVIARSVLLASLEGHHYLLVGLGDGFLLTYSVNGEIAMAAASSEELDSSSMPVSIVSDRRKLSIGTQPAQLSIFKSRGANHVFAACDRPTVVYSATGGGKLLVSNVNLQEVTRVCGFDTEAFPDSLAIATENGLHLGEVDEIQKLHITSIPLGEQPRRIAHMEMAKCFGVITETPAIDDVGDEVLEGYVRIIDDSRYDTLSKYKLKLMENGNSILATGFTGSGIDKNEQFLVVGTAFDLPTEEDPKNGRVLIFRIIEGKAVLVAEQECYGAVYNVNSHNGMLIICVGPEVRLLSVSERKDGLLNIQQLDRHRGHILAYRMKLRGDFVLVGDVVRSVALLSCKKIGENYRLEQLARDYGVVWVMAMEMLDDDTYVVADHSKHLYTFKRNSRATSDGERQRLERVGQFHLGARVNGIEHGSLVMQLAENEPAMNTMIFGTADGMLGVVATLKADKYHFFVEVQNAMATMIPGVGGLKHGEWREMKIDSPPLSAPAKNYVDGDLIERFLDLSMAQMKKVASMVNVEVEELVQNVERMQRLHGAG